MRVTSAHMSAPEYVHIQIPSELNGNLVAPPSLQRADTMQELLMYYWSQPNSFLTCGSTVGFHLNFKVTDLAQTCLIALIATAE